jgi:prepilin-type N-terminal cleavage/methylation domain-containing protein
MKKAFTLIEIIVSITIFSIVILFLYQALDITKNSNKFYSEKLTQKEENNQIKKLLFLDTINGKISKISKDRNNNSILQITTTNTYHNPFHQNITYFLSREKNLIRIESKNEFNKDKLNDEFFDNANIDIIKQKIEKFIVKNDTKRISIYLQTEDKKDILIGFEK